MSADSLWFEPLGNALFINLRHLDLRQMRNIAYPVCKLNAIKLPKTWVRQNLKKHTALFIPLPIAAESAMRQRLRGPLFHVLACYQ